ncbi:MAG: zinc ribbon domain-containing protein [Planctomycetota bacterium]|jgi:predicted nucleic-acid-binding Zn-ribbon protein
MDLDQQLGERFRCSKCQGRGAITKRVAATGTGFSKLFDIQQHRFIAVSCRKCGYTELFNPDILEGKKHAGDVLDLIFGG